MYLKYALAAALTLAPLGAAEFWEAEKFTQWNDKQCRKILEDSPWARPVTFSDEGRRGGRGNMGAQSTGSRRPGGSSPPEAAPTVNGIMRWHTAMPLKQAVVRLRFGDTAASDPQAVQMLSRPEDRYVLGLANVPASALPESLDDMKAGIRIKVNGKPDIVVDKIQPERQGRAVNLYLTFPRMRDGAPAIQLEDEEVAVEIRLPDLKLDRKFKLKEMMFAGKLEI